jgi:ABC-type multidrug transport system permease subunit
MKITKILKDMLIIAWMKSYPDFRRNPLMLLLVAMIGAIPLFFMVIFSGGNMLIHGLIGAMISGVAFIGVMAGIQDISWDRYVKIREMIVAMPVHPASYALGIALAPLLLSVPSVIFFGALIASWGVFTLEATLWTVLALVIVWAAMSAIGFMISTYLLKASMMVLNNLSNILGIGLIFIPPVYYPETMLGNLSWISLLIPTSNVAGLIRAYMGAGVFTIGDDYSAMANPYHNYCGICCFDFFEGQMARDLAQSV